MIRRMSLLALAAALLAACAPQLAPTAEPGTPTPVPEPIRIETPDNLYAPVPEDAQFEKGPVIINNISLMIMEAYPDQIALGLDGSLPNPCHQLRIRVLPFTPGGGRVDVEAYSIVDRKVICESVLKIFSDNVPIGSYPPGVYDLYFNGAFVGTFNGSFE